MAYPTIEHSPEAIPVVQDQSLGIFDSLLGAARTGLDYFKEFKLFEVELEHQENGTANQQTGVGVTYDPYGQNNSFSGALNNPNTLVIAAFAALAVGAVFVLK